MRWQETPGNINRANRVAHAFEQFRRTLVTIDHVVRADTVIKKGQRMKQYAATLAGKNIRQLRDHGLGFVTQLSAKHDYDISLGLIDCLACSFEFACINAQLLCGKRVVIRTKEREHRGIFGSRTDVDKLRSLLAQADADAVD